MFPVKFFNHELIYFGKRSGRKDSEIVLNVLVFWLMMHCSLVYISNNDKEELAACIFPFPSSKTDEALNSRLNINPLEPELNPICCLLALLGAHHFLHVSRIRVKLLTLRLLMPYIYIYIYMEHLFLMFLDHTQRRSTVGRTPPDE